jgi:hypothetical protein
VQAFTVKLALLFSPASVAKKNGYARIAERLVLVQIAIHVCVTAGAMVCLNPARTVKDRFVMDALTCVLSVIMKGVMHAWWTIFGFTICFDYTKEMNSPARKKENEVEHLKEWKILLVSNLQTNTLFLTAMIHSPFTMANQSVVRVA